MKKHLKKHLITAVASLSVLLMAGNIWAAEATATPLEWLSFNSSGLAGTGNSNQPVISGDGRYVTFASTSALVKEDTDKYSDIYLRDRLTGNLELVSVSTEILKGNGNSTAPVISDDGGMIAYTSSATNLVSGAVGSSDYVTSNVYLRDRATRVTKLISKSSTGIPGNKISNEPAISGDGRYITFTSLANNLVNTSSYSAQVYLHDQLKGTTELVSLASVGQAGLGDSKSSAISKDARYIAYTSIAGNLISNDANQAWDAFVYDRNSGETVRVSVSSNGEESKQPIGFGVYGVRYPTLSPDGRYVAFYSLANGLVEANTNGKWNVYLRDLITGNTELISKSNSGQPANDSNAPAEVVRNYLSNDGSLVVFQSNSTNLGVVGTASRIFKRDRRIATTEMINPLATGQMAGWAPILNPSGRYLVFQSGDNNLVTNDHNWSTDVYLTDLGERTPLDALPPLTTLSLKGIIGDNNWYTSNVILNLSAEDNQGGVAVAKVEYSLNGVNWFEFSTPVVLDGEGEFTLYYRGVDKAGNVEDVRKQAVCIDKTAPEVSTNLVDGVVLEGLDVYSLEYTALDNISGVADLTTFLDGRAIANHSEIDLDNLPFGKHTLIITAKDKAGNGSSRTVNFTVTTTIDTLKKLVDKYYAQELIDNKGIYNSLKVKLNNNELSSFVSEVKAQRDKHIDRVAADSLLEYANWILNNK